MRLYLMQHGNALDKTVDPDRPLSPQGIADVGAIGRFLAPLALDIPEVWHSDKTRARQTAERLAACIASKPKLREREGLAPKDPVRAIADAVRERSKDLAIVGHLPHLESLAGLLLTGAAEKTPIAFQQGGVVCLERDEDTVWRIRWAVVPDIVRSQGGR